MTPGRGAGLRYAGQSRHEPLLRPVVISIRQMRKPRCLDEAPFIRSIPARAMKKADPKVGLL
jgi:hypothetical protein